MNKINISNKKGMAQMWWIITGAVLAILVVIFILVWFKSSGGKAFDAVDITIGGLGDCDKDNVADTFDKCPCIPGEGDAEYTGCKADVTKDNFAEVPACDLKKRDQCKK